MAITQGSQAVVTATLMVGGTHIALSNSDTVTARLYASDGVTPLTPPKTLLSTAIGANWSSGVVVAEFSAVEMTAASPPSAVVLIEMVSGSQTRSWRIRIEIEAVNTPSGSLLFADRASTIASLRRDRLMVAASGAMPSLEVSDDYLWSKLVAAEAEVSRLLRVPLVPTKFFPKEPTSEQIAALPAGMPWGIDPGYDYSPDFFQGDRFGLTKLRNKPIISVSSLAFAYPSAVSPAFTFPIEWLRIDKKYGQVQIVPTTSAYMATMNTFVLQSLSSGRQIPLALEFTYIAGLTDAVNNWPDLIDLIKKKAALSIIEDTFMPASGSISADGLSQSMSVQMDQYHDMIDRKLYGPKGSNGGLMSAIHGIRVGGMLG